MLCGLLMMGVNFFLLVFGFIVMMYLLVLRFLSVWEGVVRYSLLLVVSKMIIFGIDGCVLLRMEVVNFKILVMLCWLIIFCVLFNVFVIVIMFWDEEN